MLEADPNLAAVERDFLRAICRRANLANSVQIDRALAHYSWRVSDHQVVFEALRRIARTRAASLPALSEEVTRMGFPDIELTEYFSPSPAEQTPRSEIESDEIVMALLAQLKETAASK